MKKKFLKGRNSKVLASLGLILAVFGSLIYFQQMAIIYLLSTVGLIVLLLIVAFADLERVGVEARNEAFGAAPGSEPDEVAALKLNTLSDKRANQSKLIRNRRNGEIRST